MSASKIPGFSQQAVLSWPTFVRAVDGSGSRATARLK
jgi:hypothetical protein